MHLHNKANVSKEMQTWAKMAKDAKAQAELAQKEIKANTPQSEVIKTHKATSVNKMEMMNTTLDAEASRKAYALHKRKPTRRCQESRKKDWGIRYFICFNVEGEKR